MMPAPPPALAAREFAHRRQQALDLEQRAQRLRRLGIELAFDFHSHVHAREHERADRRKPVARQFGLRHACRIDARAQRREIAQTLGRAVVELARADGQERCRRQEAPGFGECRVACLAALGDRLALGGRCCGRIGDHRVRRAALDRPIGGGCKITVGDRVDRLGLRNGRAQIDGLLGANDDKRQCHGGENKRQRIELHAQCHGISPPGATGDN
jgi:hypothetical protein